MRRATQLDNDSGGPGSPIERGGSGEPGGSPGPSHPSSRAPPLSSAWSLARASSTQQLEGFNHTDSSPFQPFQQQQQQQAQQLLAPQEPPPAPSLEQRLSGPPPLSEVHTAALEQLQRAAVAPPVASDQGPQQQPCTQEASHQPLSRHKKPPRPQRARPPAAPTSGAMDARDVTVPISTNTGTGGEGAPQLAPPATVLPAAAAAAAPCDTAAAAAINTALFIINAAEAIRGGDLPQQGTAAESQLHRALELTVQVQREATSKLLQHAQADPHLRQQLQEAGLWERLSQATGAAAWQAMPPPGAGTQGAPGAAQQAQQAQQQAQQQGGTGMDQVASLLDLAPLLSSAATVMATLHGIPSPTPPSSGAGAGAGQQQQQQQQQGPR